MGLAQSGEGRKERLAAKVRNESSPSRALLDDCIEARVTVVDVPLRAKSLAMAPEIVQVGEGRGERTPPLFGEDFRDLEVEQGMRARVEYRSLTGVRPTGICARTNHGSRLGNRQVASRLQP